MAATAPSPILLTHDVGQSMALRAEAMISRGAALPALLLGFFAFLPYPALNAGNQSAIQFGNVLSFFMVLPILVMSWRNRPYWILPLIVVPMLISSLKLAFTGEGDITLCPKVTTVFVISCLTLLVT